MVKKKLTYRERWNKEHPLIQIRLPKDVYMEIEKLQTTIGKHKNDIIKDMINGLVVNFQDYRNNILNDVIDEFINDPDFFYERHIKPNQKWFFFFTIPCRKCKEPMLFTITHPEAKIIFARLKYYFSEWYVHEECKAK